MITYSKILQAYKEHRGAGNVMVPTRDSSMKNVRSKLSFVRLSLSGALLGISLINLVGPMIGIPTHTFTDGVGAVTGFSAVALLKVSHLI
jgi:hypothetical protein